MSDLSFAFPRAAGTIAWTVASPVEKLALRATLPGAYMFDRAAEALADARAHGVEPASQLALALAASWLVNNNVASPTFRKWLAEPALHDAWRALIGCLSRGGLADADADAAKERVRAHASALGAGAGAISKVLALLVPDVVPLLPDAALAFALGTPAPPSDKPDAQTASVDLLVPALAWFADTVAACGASLVEVTRAAGTRLSPAQALDRLIWFDSVGYRHFRGWAPVARDGGAAIAWTAPDP